MATKKYLITPAHVFTMKPDMIYFEGHEYAIKRMLQVLDGILDHDPNLSEIERAMALDIRTIVKRMSREHNASEE